MRYKKGEVLWKVVRSTSNILAYIGMGMLFVLMVLGTADVIGRYVFDRPITGTLEISEILLAGVVFFGWAYTQAARAHVRVEIITSRFPHRTQTMTDFVTSLLALGLFGLIVWCGTKTTISYLDANRMVQGINVPIFPFQALVPFGALFVCLILVTQIIRLFTQLRKVD